MEKSDEFRETDWQLFVNALQMAERLWRIRSGYRLDQEGADQLARG